MSYLLVCLVWVRRPSAFAAGGQVGAIPLQALSPPVCGQAGLQTREENRGKGTLLLIVLAPGPAPLGGLVGLHSWAMCSMTGFPCVSVLGSVCARVIGESLPVWASVSSKAGPGRTSTRAAPAGSGEMKPQPWFSPRGFSQENLYFPGAGSQPVLSYQHWIHCLLQTVTVKLMYREVVSFMFNN